jgi:hypothetical protein
MCRTYRFATLGLSLSNLLDINNPQDLLRAILNTVTEYDQAKEDNDNRPRMVSKGPPRSFDGAEG